MMILFLLVSDKDESPGDRACTVAHTSGEATADHWGTALYILFSLFWLWHAFLFLISFLLH